MPTTTDVIVVGLGTCGEDMALRLLAAGLDVVGIEPRLIGGECPYYACLPTKSMVRSANLLQEARRADGLVGRVEVTADWSLVARRVRDEITGGWDDANAVARFGDRGGHLVRGWGRLAGPRSVAVGDDVFEARRGIIIATGSRPWLPPIAGLEGAGCWTTRDAVRAEQLPASLVVLGGGAVGCELGQVFARFGTAVTIVEAAPRLLPAEEPEASSAVMGVFADEGIHVRTGTKVTAVERDDEGALTVALADGERIAAAQVLVAAGRRVDVSQLGAEAADLDVSSGYVGVDGRLRAADGIWAVGDVTGKGMFTHVALYQATIAVADLLGNEPAPADYRMLPRVTFTDPEVASVGLNEQAARDDGHDVDVVTKQVPATFRGWLHRTGGDGVIKLVADRSEGTVLGGTVVGPHGGEVVGLLCAAIRGGLPVSDLVDMIYPFPTFLGGIGEAIGAYGRGLVTVLDPGATPMFTD